jgi:hypothetical protein
MSKDFEHQQAAHCETGVISSLMRHHGLPLSEPMAFGLASGLTYAYLPVVKINGLPLMAYRMPPRMILKLLAKRIDGLNIRFETFRDEQQGMLALDNKLANNEVVGLQASVFFLPYFPKAMRFHFNAHNLLVYGKEEGEYHISDPVFSHTVKTDQASLQKSRFSRGALAPKGMMYYFESVPESINFEKIIPKAIRFTARMNGRWNPLPFAGVSGMKMIAKKIGKLDKEDPRYARLFLGHIVRMQEEIGTGGAGFRFMYAAFLQESSDLLSNPRLSQIAQEMTAVGDEWREFALLAARMSKQRGEQAFTDIEQQLRKTARMELEIYNQLSSYKIK